MQAEPVPGRPKGKGKGKGASTSKPKTASASAAPGTTVLPAARVSKIIKADRDITKCTKEAVFLVSVTAEHFVRRLADAAYTRARLDQRKVVTYKDVGGFTSLSPLEKGICALSLRNLMYCSKLLRAGSRVLLPRRQVKALLSISSLL
jgi:histone H3/H4